LQKAGLRDLEREATFAIERGRTWHAICEHPNLNLEWKPSDLRLSVLECRWQTPYLGFAEGIFRLVAFELTTGYGLYPGRALLIIIVLWMLLIPVYAWAIFRMPHWLDSPGIYRIWSKERIEASAGRVRLSDATDVERLSERDWRAIPWAAYFSLLSAFHIGFRDFNVGNWIARVQAGKYTLEPTGWVRVVSGLQSLLSVYLLAIWALTYFSRPFQ
jgi:hypothetical protein